mmetsp:Transcript_56005/g.114470  ORF Transcript_56005/g.114470 Transcript_56005/m.114470 type:complete len:369 (+) Transcript_56005:4241-5347(+)
MEKLRFLQLRDYNLTEIKKIDSVTSSFGSSPFFRPISSLIRNGIINLDKPCGISVQELQSKIKNLFGIKKIRTGGWTDTNSTGCLLVFLENSRCLTRKQFEQKEDFIGVFKISPGFFYKKAHLRKIFENFNGFILQNTPFFSLVRRQLSIKNIYSSFLLEFQRKRNLVIFFFSSDFGLNTKALTSHLSVLIGEGSRITELRKIRSGFLTEKDFLVNFHILADAVWFYKCRKNEYLIRKTIMPLEIVLTKYRRIIVKNSAINSLCYGANLATQGVSRLDKNIETGEEVLLVSSKGEAIAIAQSVINSQSFNGTNSGFIATVKNIIMRRDVYPKEWGLGCVSVKKKLLFSIGILKSFKKKNSERHYKLLS